MSGDDLGEKIDLQRVFFQIHPPMYYIVWDRRINVICDIFPGKLRTLFSAKKFKKFRFRKDVSKEIQISMVRNLTIQIMHVSSYVIDRFEFGEVRAGCMLAHRCLFALLAVFPVYLTISILVSILLRSRAIKQGEVMTNAVLEE